MEKSSLLRKIRDMRGNHTPKGTLATKGKTGGAVRRARVWDLAGTTLSVEAVTSRPQVHPLTTTPPAQSLNSQLDMK